MAAEEAPIESVAGIQNALIHKHDPVSPEAPSSEFSEFSGPAAKRAKIEGPTCEAGIFSGGVTRHEPDVFQIIVGPQNYTTKATRQVLSLSPVLARLISDRWREGRSQEIEFPEEEPIDIYLLLEFLKSGLSKLPPDMEQYIPPHRQNVDKVLVVLDKLADLFILADRYDLPLLQTHVIQTLSANKNFLQTPRSFLRVALKIFQSQSDTWQIYWTFFHKRFPLLTSHITPTEIDLISEEFRAGGQDLALNILLAEENRAQLLVANHTSTVNKTVARKDAYHLFAEHLKRQNQELAEKWALESAARAQAEVLAQRVAELERELAETKARLAEAQGGVQFRRTYELQLQLRQAQDTHVCEHAAHYDCGFEHRPEQSGKRKWQA